MDCTDWKLAIPITYQPIHSDKTRLLGPNLPNWTPYARLGWLAKTVIAGEDAPFFTHAGFNEEGLNRAMNELLRERDNPIGGSSITQQVAKKSFHWKPSDIGSKSRRNGLYPGTGSCTLQGSYLGTLLELHRVWRWDLWNH